ncbi:RNA-directed DNA polymerase from mobile element jockey [Trichonephila clavipes]|nr:RNA-directed DNA polymerase from mobile element jockey [Trichonephila clavipes]
MAHLMENFDQHLKVSSYPFKKGNYKNKLNPLKLFRNHIPWCDEVQYLGVALDKKLTYRNHILQTSKKFKLKLFTLHRLLSKKSKLNLDKKRLIYLQHLLPVILYACQIWGNSANYLLNKLQILQNQALRTILNAPFYIPRIILHRELKITSIRSRIKKLSLPFYNHLPSHHNESIRMQSSFPVTGTHRPPTMQQPYPDVSIRNFTQTEKKRPPGVGSLNIGSPLHRRSEVSSVVNVAWNVIKLRKRYHAIINVHRQVASVNGVG